MKSPVEVAPLFSILDEKLFSLLRSLTAEEWNKSTIAKLWRVKDVAAHLLDGNIRGISLQQHKYFGDPPSSIDTYKDLVAYLNRLNADWVHAAKRISPLLLIELLEITGKSFCELMASLPPLEKAMFSVAWAGEEESFNWMHVAREYTEKWHHQQQIRNAVGKEDELMTKGLFYPFIDTLMYGLPYSLRHSDAKDGTCVLVTITTEVGGDWFVIKQDGKWMVSKTGAGKIQATVFIPPEIAWKLFTKGLSPGQAKENVQMSGDLLLCKAALQMVSVMA